MMRSMFSGVTGLKAFQTSMDVIGNNIANINTIGFKGERVGFQTTLNQTLQAAMSAQGLRGGINPMQIGLGAQIASIDKMMSQGSLENTGKKTDLAIQGDGFFVLNNGNGGKVFSRAGNFTLDEAGYLVNASNGMRLQGWGADSSNGNFVLDTTKPINDIQIPSGLSMDAKATSYMKLTDNLKADVGLKDLLMKYTDDEGNTQKEKFNFSRDLSDLDHLVYNMSYSDPDDAAKLIDSYGGKLTLNENGLVSDGYAESYDNSVTEMTDTSGTSDITNVSGSYMLLDSNNDPVKIKDTVLHYDGTTPSNSTLTITLDDGSTQVFNYSGTADYSELGDLANWSNSSGYSLMGNLAINGSNPTTSVSDISLTTTNKTTSINAYSLMDVSIPSGSSIKSLTGGFKVVNETTGQEITLTNANVTIDDSGNIKLKYDFNGDGTIDDTNEVISLQPSVGALPNTKRYFGEATIGGSNFAVYANLKMDGTLPATGNTDTISFSTDKDTLRIPSQGTPKFVEADNATNYVTADFENPSRVASVQVYDSLGNPYNVYVKFTKVSTNAWMWQAEESGGLPVYGIDENGNVLKDDEGNPKPARGIIAFDENGRMVADNWSIDSDGNIVENGGPKGITFEPAGAGGALNPALTPPTAAGAGTVKASLDFFGLTQYSSPFTAIVREQDGRAEGTLQSFNINSSGEIVGTFSNGLSATLGKVALATFDNAAGLNDLGNSLYASSANSGSAIIGESGTGGRGSITPGALEMSNVDIAEEFTKMIVAQRGYQANSRVITTTDQILQELVNIKR
jgi:flagellar hook protein FlgE